MFAGEYLCKLDEKGRFMVPGPMRERLETEGNGVVFLKGPEQALWAYSTAEWDKVLDRTRTKLDEDQSRLFMHFVVAEAGTSDVDKWLTSIGEFMKANGTFPEAPATKNFVTDEYLRMVDRDPKLKEFANKAN